MFERTQEITVFTSEFILEPETGDWREGIGPRNQSVEPADRLRP